MTAKYLSGRPGYYADLSKEGSDQTLELMDAFHEVVSTLRYREIMGLARAFSCSYEAVLRWKYNLSKPSYEIMMIVIEWGKAGKPLTLKKRKSSWDSML